MALIKDIIAFRKFIRVSFTYSEVKALPDIQLIEDRHIKPIIGNDIYDELQSQVNSPDYPDNLQWQALWNCIGRVTVPLSMVSALSLKHITVTDNGMKKTSTEQTENVFKWEYMEVKDELLTAAAIALDELWQHLYENGDDYEWTDPQSYPLIIKTAKEFNSCYALHQPYRVFPMLQPVIKSVEKLYINGAIGATFLQELKDIDPADLVITEEDTDEEKAIKKIKTDVLDSLKLAVANYTIHKAFSKLPIRITDKGLTVIYEADRDKSESGERSAALADVEDTKRDALAEAKLHMGQLKKLLNTNASDELFTTFYESELYIAPGTTQTNVNDDMTGLMGF